MDQVGQQKFGSKSNKYYSSGEDDSKRDGYSSEDEDSKRDFYSKHHDSLKHDDNSKNHEDFKHDDDSKQHDVRTKMDLYTLPIFQSAGISCRTPTNRLYNIHSWHLPDFGGSIDTLDVSLKNNSLGSCPFKPKYAALPLFVNTEKYQPVKHEMADSFLKSTQCNRLFLANNPNIQNMISIYLASRSTLTLQPRVLQDYLPNTQCWESYFPFNVEHKPHHSRTFSQDIIGLHCDNKSSILLVNCINESTAIRLSHPNAAELPFSYKESTTIEFKCKPRKEKFIFKNVCINPYRPGILTYALDGKEVWELREYDLNSKQTQIPLTKYSCKNDTYSSKCIISALRSKAVVKTRSYKIEGDFERIQSITAFPNHLQNILYTTNTRSGVFDSRCPDLDSAMIVEKSKLCTLHPLESFHGSIFSKLDDHQFYVLSDSHIRIFDLRYHNTVLNQLSHALKMGKIHSLESMILDDEFDVPKEVVMINDGESICMNIFGKHPTEKNLVNPISCSPPMFVSKPTDSFFKVHGSDLSIIQDTICHKQISGLQMVKIEKKESSISEDVRPCFDLIQLIENGSLFYQRFYHFSSEDGVSALSVSPYINRKISESDPYPVPEGYLERMAFISSDLNKVDYLNELIKSSTKERTYHEDFDLIGDDGEIIPMDTDAPNIVVTPKPESGYTDPICYPYGSVIEEDIELPLTEQLSKDEITVINQEKLKQSRWLYL